MSTPWRAVKIEEATGLLHKRAAGFDKCLHDLRGTAATRFICAGASDPQVADILGWEPTRVSAIRKRYVDAGNVARSVVRLLEPEAKDR